MPLLFSAQDTRWMARALQLAEQGRRSTAPNPRVGCVIAHGDLVVGDATRQHQKDIILSHKGWNHFQPMMGVGLKNYLSLWS